VSEEARGAGGAPIWDLLSQYLRAKKILAPPKLNLPRLVGVEGNPGLARLNRESERRA
jgi:sulfur-oxidizing protein SoxB